MLLRYYTVDVFTNTRFGGNPLAVVPDASALSDAQMQAIASEFNYSESTFVLPCEDADNDAKVRIFMPTQEIPFAGHPNVGTAHVLAATGALGPLDDDVRVARFEEQAGIVPVRIESRGGVPVRCELTAPGTLEIGPTLDPGQVARALSISSADIVTRTHAPLIASAGLQIALVEVSDADVLARARTSAPAWAECTDVDGVYVYRRAAPEDAHSLYCRMFAPAAGIPEDPATGSAACALAGLLAHCDARADAELGWTLYQGMEMGRPSELSARAVKTGGEVRSMHVGGGSVMMMSGMIDLG